MTTNPSDPAAPAPRNNAGRTRGRPFQRGNRGRPKGARHKTTLAVEALLDGEAEKLTRKCIKLALAGDATAMRLCFDRIAPVRKGRVVAFPMPEIRSTSDVLQAMSMLSASMAAGLLSAPEAHEIAGVIELYRKAIEQQNLEGRMAAIEAAMMRGRNEQ
jgi:hypothetical protein